MARDAEVDRDTMIKYIETLFSSSSEEEDEELFAHLAILHEKNKIPKLKNFKNIVTEYSNKEVSFTRARG